MTALDEPCGKTKQSKLGKPMPSKDAISGAVSGTWRHLHTAVKDNEGSWIPKKLTRPKSEDDKLNMTTGSTSLKRSSSDSSSSRILRKAGRARSMMLFEIPLNLGKNKPPDACQSPRARPTISGPLEGSFQHLDGGGRSCPAIRKSLSEYNLARMTEAEPTGRDTRLRPGFVCLSHSACSCPALSVSLLCVFVKRHF